MGRCRPRLLITPHSPRPNRRGIDAGTLDVLPLLKRRVFATRCVGNSGKVTFGNSGVNRRLPGDRYACRVAGKKWRLKCFPPFIWLNP